jgi:hypothetical protein
MSASDRRKMDSGDEATNELGCNFRNSGYQHRKEDDKRLKRTIKVK